MLADAGDLDRLVALATDPARHHRMLDATGGDAAALAEIAAAHALISAANPPTCSPPCAWPGTAISSPTATPTSPPSSQQFGQPSGSPFAPKPSPGPSPDPD